MNLGTKMKFIPVNNSIEKAIAFANSLDQNYLKNTQKINQKEFYIPTLDVVNKLRNEGWQLNGVDEQRGKSRKTINNFVQMIHPDFAVKNNKGKDEAWTSLTITNSCNGAKPLEMNIGMFRQVCSNGLIRFDKQAEQEKIKHIEVNANNLDKFITSVTNKTDLILNDVLQMKRKGLTYEEMKELAIEAAKLKHTNLDDINIDDLFAVNRVEDEGNDLWTVYNRIQENLTQDVTNIKADINLNKQLYRLANQYSLAV